MAQRILGSALQPCKGALCRAIVLAEELYCPCGRERILSPGNHRDHSKLHYSAAKSFSDNIFVTPQYRRNHSSRRRHMFRDQLEHLTDKAAWSPIGHRDLTARAANPY